MKNKRNMNDLFSAEIETAIDPNGWYALPELWNGGCLELMKQIPDNSIDMVVRLLNRDAQSKK